MKATIFIALLAGAIISTVHFGETTGASVNHQAIASMPKAKAPEAKKEVVKLYPNPSYNGTVTISSHSEKPLHFYVFDVEGTLLHQFILKDKSKQTIHNLKKGTYVYDAFLNDEGIDHGSISVR